MASGKVRRMVDSDTAGAAGDDGSVGERSELMARLEAGYATVQARQQAERDSFIPSSVLERLCLQILGGWQNVIGAVNFASFHAAGHGADWKPEDKLPKAMRELAEGIGLRWPHEDFAGVVAHAGAVRHKLAHMLYIMGIEGEWPERVLTFARLGHPDDPRSRGRVPGELSWVDETWSEQRMHLHSITEEELRRTLDELRWLKDCVRALSRMHNILREIGRPADDLQLDLEGSWWLPWVQPGWFADPEHPTFGEIRLQ